MMKTVFICGLAKLRVGLLAIVFLCGLTACGADDLWEDLEVDLTHFSTDKTDLYPGEEIHFVWEAESVFEYDVRFYLSEDDRKSSDDFRFINEECDDYDDYCETDRRTIYTCLYLIDNSFDCDHNNDLISVNDITSYLKELPMFGYVIMEVCDETRCERAIAELNLF